MEVRNDNNSKPIRASQLEVAASALSVLEAYSKFSASMTAISRIVATYLFYLAARYKTPLPR